MENNHLQYNLRSYHKILRSIYGDGNGNGNYSSQCFTSPLHHPLSYKTFIWRPQYGASILRLSSWSSQSSPLLSGWGSLAWTTSTLFVRFCIEKKTTTKKQKQNPAKKNVAKNNLYNILILKGGWKITPGHILSNLETLILSIILRIFLIFWRFWYSWFL